MTRWTLEFVNNNMSVLWTTTKVYIKLTFCSKVACKCISMYNDWACLYFYDFDQQNFTCSQNLSGSFLCVAVAVAISADQDNWQQPGSSNN